MRPINISTDAEIAWLAGLLEGEGCFLGDAQIPIIEIEMTDLDIIKRVARIFNRKLRTISRSSRHKNLKDIHRVRVTGKKAIQVMLLILPFMGLRRTLKIRSVLI